MTVGELRGLTGRAEVWACSPVRFVLRTDAGPVELEIVGRHVPTVADPETCKPTKIPVLVLELKTIPTEV